jgi:hypothetical protein
MLCRPGYHCACATTHNKKYFCIDGYYSASDSISSASQCHQCSTGYYCPPDPTRYILPEQLLLSSCHQKLYPLPMPKWHIQLSQRPEICPKMPSKYCWQDLHVKMHLPKIFPLGSYMDVTEAFIADDSTTAGQPILVACK